MPRRASARESPGPDGAWAERQASVVFVTHDLEEAVALADKVYVLTAGPATVKSVYTIDLPRPRTGQVRASPEFSRYEAELREYIEETSNGTGD